MKIKASEAVIGRFYLVDDERKIYIGKDYEGSYCFDSPDGNAWLKGDEEITPLNVTNWTDEPSPSPPSTKISREHYDRLDQRRLWLSARAHAKASIGWDAEYDLSEHDALVAVLAVVEVEEAKAEHPPIPEGWRLVDKEKDKPKLESDLFWRTEDINPKWIGNVDGSGHLIDNGVFHSDCLYIRRIAPNLPDPGPDHRIASGEDWRDERCEVWVNCPSGGFWDDREHVGRPFDTGLTYRVPITPVYRPFANAEEALPFIGKPVRRKDAKSIWQVNGATDIRVAVGVCAYDHGCAFDLFEQLDGSPFGVKVSP